eukprot:Lankesteria_metandrocarpae@DN4179_c0_g1_i1.p1
MTTGDTPPEPPSVLKKHLEEAKQPTKHSGDEAIPANCITHVGLAVPPVPDARTVKSPVGRVVADTNVPSPAHRLALARTQFHVHTVGTLPDKLAAPHTYTLSAAQRDAMVEWLHNKCLSGVITKLNNNNTIKVNNPHFVVFDKDQQHKPRIVGDFKALNRFTLPIYDATTHVDAVRAWVAQQRYVCKLDLSAGFHNVPVAPATKPLLGFVFDNQQYVYNYMPMGVRNGPATFCQWLLRVFEHCMDGTVLNEHVRVYQDDIFVAGSSVAERLMYISKIRSMCEKYGICINESKTAFSENGFLVLGVWFCNGYCSLPKRSIECIEQLIANVLLMPSVTKRIIYKIIGKIAFFRSLSVSTTALLQPLYDWCKDVDGWSTTSPLTSSMRRALREIQQLLPTWRIQLPEVTTTTTVHIYTDASNIGLGVAVYIDNKEVHNWSLQYKTKSSCATSKELAAILMFLRRNVSFLQQLKSRRWTFHSDNLPAVVFLQRQKVPVDHKKVILLEKIFNLLQDYKATTSFVHIAGKDNRRADLLSRQ